jgi:type IV pilus assembly protein PilW
MPSRIVKLESFRAYHRSRDLRLRVVARGFSVVELMVALTIASLLLLALATLFINTSSSRQEIDRSSRQIESGRYAIQVLSDDIRHAGYYGPLINAPTNTAALTALPDPCSTALSDIQNNAFLPLQGYAGASNAANLDAGKLACLNAAAGYKPNTAVLVVRRIDTTISTAANAPTANYFNIQVSGCPGDASAYALNTDTASPSPYTLHSNGAPGCTPITSAPLATLAPFYTRIYFISTCSNSDCSAAGANSVPTLKRIDIQSTTRVITPIVDGIENLQFDYGIDTTAAPGDGTPDVYTNSSAHVATTPSSITEWQNVMTVRIYLLARSIEPSSGFTDTKTYVLGPVSVAAPSDSYRRHAYNELVRLNNPAGRRE